jgi:RimJ/RimL family protein N-acetyltransferase
MDWELTNSLDEFERVAAPHLLADPVRQTVALSVLASLRAAGLARFGDGPPLFGWHRRGDGTVDGAVLQTPPFPLLLASLPAGSVAGLLTVLSAERGLPTAVSVDAASEAPVLADWVAVTGGGTGTARLRSRLYRLGELNPPDPGPAGAPRLAGQADTDLLIEWHEAFRLEAEGAGPEDASRTVADRLSHDGLLLWEVGGEPVAMAGLTHTVAGVARIAGVYTPRPHRRQGYGGAITTAASQTARDRGASEVVLFTDLANPTSNALYQRLGYRSVEDRVMLDLTAGVTRVHLHSS